MSNLVKEQIILKINRQKLQKTYLKIKKAWERFKAVLIGWKERKLYKLKTKAI